MRISIEKSVAFSLKLRVPSWATADNCLKLNGERLNQELNPDHWVSIERIWNDGDIVTVDYPYTLAFRAVDAKNADIVALSFGPIVLVTDQMTKFIGDPNQPASWIIPAEGEAFTFITDKGHVAGYDFLTRTFTPYYKIGPMQWYYMYNRIRPL